MLGVVGQKIRLKEKVGACVRAPALSSHASCSTFNVQRSPVQATGERLNPHEREEHKGFPLNVGARILQASLSYVRDKCAGWSSWFPTPSACAQRDGDTADRVLEERMYC